MSNEQFSSLVGSLGLKSTLSEVERARADHLAGSFIVLREILQQMVDIDPNDLELTPQASHSLELSLHEIHELRLREGLTDHQVLQSVVMALGILDPGKTRAIVFLKLLLHNRSWFYNALRTSSPNRST